MLGKKVFTNGCFDILHVGHLETIRFARYCAGKNGHVIVGLNDDASVQRLKGTSRPIMRLADRMALVGALKYVDVVLAFSEDTPEELIKKVQPDIIVKGGDYMDFEDEVVGSDAAEIRIAPLKGAISTSYFIDKIVGLNS